MIVFNQELSIPIQHGSQVNISKHISKRPKNPKFQFFESKEEVCVEKNADILVRINFAFLTICFHMKKQSSE